MNKKDRCVIAGTGRNMVVFGSVMGVRIEPVDSEHTMLVVVPRRKAGDNFTKLTATRFYERFNQVVSILHTDETLPFVPSEK